MPRPTPRLDSLVPVFAGADWHERETHEMFGIEFTGHPGLAPLLLPPGFEGHPLRKDFVLAARVAKALAGGEGAGRGPAPPPGPAARRTGGLGAARDRRCRRAAAG